MGIEISSLVGRLIIASLADEWPTTLKGAWSRHVTHLMFGSPIIALKRLRLGS